MPSGPAAPLSPASRTRLVAGSPAALTALALLFAARVAAQAIQRWLPVFFLPPFATFQGSALPYWILLPAQLAILALMLSVARRVHQGTLSSRPTTGRALAVFGGVYLAIMLARIVIGLTVPDAPMWFKATISVVFHLVLATFVLVLARYHLRGSQSAFSMR
jgi:drug/metabolite transporter superfamily protein YnfA